LFVFPSFFTPTLLPPTHLSPSSDRSLLSSHLSSSFLHVVLPNPSGLPTSSATEIDDGGGAGVPAEAKYLALDVMSELCSKHEGNKGRLRELMPPFVLGFFPFLFLLREEKLIDPPAELTVTSSAGSSRTPSTHI
jgi:hypothetical protein